MVRLVCGLFDLHGSLETFVLRVLQGLRRVRRSPAHSGGVTVRFRIVRRLLVLLGQSTSFEAIAYQLRVGDKTFLGALLFAIGLLFEVLPPL